MTEARVRGLKVGHQRITPMCRINRGTTAAFIEAASRLEHTYGQYVDSPENSNVTWHLVLVREEAE